MSKVKQDSEMSEQQQACQQSQQNNKKKDDNSKKGQKKNKQSFKDGFKFNNRDKKELQKVKAKSQQAFSVKGEQGQVKRRHGDLKTLKDQFFQGGELKINLKEQQSRYPVYQNVSISQENLAKLYCQCEGDIVKISFILKIGSLFNLCKMILPIVRSALKSLEGIVKKRKLRRVFLPWNDLEMKEFVHKFFEITNGQLFGFSKKLQLDVFWKIVKMKYDNTITITNQQGLDFYKSCLDLHLSVYQDLQSKTTDFQRHMTWSRPQLKVFCRLLLKTDNLQKVSDVMVMQFGKLKEKFSPKKLFQKIDTLIKMSASKIKHQCVTYPGLGDIRKMLRHDFYNINYNQGTRYEQIRRQLIQYFEHDLPPLQQTYDTLCRLNKFLDEERIYQKNQISDGYLRDGVQIMRSETSGQRAPTQVDYNQNKIDQKGKKYASQKNQYFSEIKQNNFIIAQNVKKQNIFQNNENMMTLNRQNSQQNTLQKDNSLLHQKYTINVPIQEQSSRNFGNNAFAYQKNLDYRKHGQIQFQKSMQMPNLQPKQLPQQLKNLIQMDLESLSSSDLQQQDQQKE